GTGFQIAQTNTNGVVTAQPPTIDIQNLDTTDTTTLMLTAPFSVLAGSNYANIDASSVAGALDIKSLGDNTVGDIVNVSKVGPQANLIIDGGATVTFANIGAGRLDQIRHDVTVHNAVVTVDNSTGTPSIFTLDFGLFMGWTAIGGAQPFILLDN